MSMRMRRKRNFESRMAACGDFLLARGAGGILNMKEAAEKYRALVDFPPFSATIIPWNWKSDAERAALYALWRRKIPPSIFWR